MKQMLKKHNVMHFNHSILGNLGFWTEWWCHNFESMYMYSERKSFAISAHA